MTSAAATHPASLADRVSDLLAAPDAPVLQRRQLHPDADLSALPRFGDACWDLSAALPDRHTTGPRISWSRFPQPLRHACKVYVFALVNVVEEVPRLANSGGHAPSIKTLQEDLQHLRAFANWLSDSGITRFDEVTTNNLGDYLHHVTDKPAASTHWKRKSLLAVQRLHAYRDVLPDYCRLPAAPLWGAASAAELAEHPTARLGENRTPRIHPDVMHPLLSAALLVTDTIAADLLPTAQRLVAMRHLAHQIAPPARREPLKGTARRNAVKQHLERLLPALAEAGHALPGLRQAGETVLDIDGLAVGGWLDSTYLTRWPAMRDAIDACDLPIKVNLLRTTRFTPVNDQLWRTRPVAATELVALLRHVITACFLVTAYLSGVRTGEALNLRRGCINRDAKLGLTFMSGQQMKARPPRRERSLRTIPWVVTEHVAHAVSLLEDLCTGQMLFPLGEVCSPQWVDVASRGSCRSRAINDDITEFIGWFNTHIAPATGHPPIGEDPQGRITVPRLRRTLAWHIVRRPGGTVAGATQYGHLRTQIMHGYAGGADSGFFDEITFEEFLLRAETLHDDQQRLLHGEHVSGPAADAYQVRVAAARRFAGLTITTPAQANNALASPALQVHHGALLTCVYRPETAACQQDSPTERGPSWARCRPTCRNLARTDRDITNLRQHILVLKSDLASPGLPQPLRVRIQQRVDEHEQAIVAHDSTRPLPPASKPTGNLT